MLIAEELVLLAVDDQTGRRLIGTDKLDPALGGALLAELALLERVGITAPDAGLLARNKLTVTSDRPTDDTELDRALAVVVTKEGVLPQRLISSASWKPITNELRSRLLHRLVERGVLTQETGTVLKIFPTTRWPTYDPGPERAIRERLRSAVVDGLTPDDRTRVLIGLLHVTGLLPKTVSVDTTGIDRGTLRHRGKEIAAGDWAVTAVKKAIDEVAAAGAAGAT